MFEKYVQNPPQTFNINHFSHPAIFSQKRGRNRSPHTIPTKKKVDLKNTFKIHTKRSKLILLATLRQQSKKGKQKRRSLMAGGFTYFRSLTTIFSSYRFDALIWHTNSESTLGEVTKTGLKNYLPFFSWQLTQIENGT